jgi:hypothetical protein
MSAANVNVEIDIDPLDATGLCLVNEPSSSTATNLPNTDNLIFTINNPEALQRLGKLAKTDEAMRFSNSQPESEGDTRIPFSHFRRLHVGILASITAEISLDAKEMNGGVDGEIMAPLLKAWQDGFRTIPPDHQIEQVCFDMRCEQQPELRHIRRLLQQASTVLWLKAQKNRESRRMELMCTVVGCNEEKKRWLEAALPGKKEAVDVS